MDMHTVVSVISICAAIILHSAIISWGAGRIREQLQNVCARMEKWETTMEKGGFAHCQLHTQRLLQLEQRMDHLEDKVS